MSEQARCRMVAWDINLFVITIKPGDVKLPWGSANQFHGMEILKLPDPWKAIRFRKIRAAFINKLLIIFLDD